MRGRVLAVIVSESYALDDVKVRRTSTAQNRVAAALARLATITINDDGRETVHVDSEEAKGAFLCVIDGVPRWAVGSATGPTRPLVADAKSDPPPP